MKERQGETEREWVSGREACAHLNNRENKNRIGLSINNFTVNRRNES